MGRKRFHCIFPMGENVHLIKDVGMIPYVLQKEGYYDSYISFYEKAENLPYLKNEVKGLNYKPIKRIFKNNDFNVFLFLFSNFRKMDYVMMFHPSFKKIFICFLFKILSFNRLKFYFKLDLDESIFQSDVTRKTFVNSFKKKLYNYTALFTAETKKINDFLNNGSYFNTKYLTNGFINTKPSNPPVEKENILLTVGRIGSYQKNTEVLLDAIKNINLLDWKIVIIGPIEEDFIPIVDEFFLSNPSLKQNVYFLGSVSDRDQLEEYYQKSKVFVLTSRYEGFPLVFTEAIKNGCFIVSSDLVCAIDITNNEEFGRLFPIGNSQELSFILQNVIDGNTCLPPKESIMKYAEENYNWSVLVRRLYELLESK
ncbi:glycosyltransferase [Chryseobacterium polytrichastri]|uniref:Glycosyltransferase involved in cell wall bisynthesis n=1 Tax=Chryseobacterium polytrichastri TaxID=1302687 RepID=A0A1M6U4Q6_9FLAO|nr:glycosyltransferase [Chryseobacterium polytrichastri]SHK64150.1 Glycosyltransferase involved in cell wall bisynthesis [Chryseobacterium polytrichastri]